MPEHLQGTDFGPTLNSYILHQYYGCGVSQPVILSSLRDYGVDISSGQISNILIGDKSKFHQEKQDLLAKAIVISDELRTDDTGARHRFKNAYCNCINSDLFTYFTTTYSKSRLNFLTILSLGRTDHQLNQVALDYMRTEGLPPKYLSVFQRVHDTESLRFNTEEELTTFLEGQRFTATYAIKTIKEALLIGSITEKGLDPSIMVHSDGAGQFNLFVHSLCWKHAERPLVKLKCHHPVQVEQLEQKLKPFGSSIKALKLLKPIPWQSKFQYWIINLMNYANRSVISLL